MRFTTLLEANRDPEAGLQLIADIGKYNEALVKASVLFRATRPRVSVWTLEAMKRPSVRIRALRLALKRPEPPRCAHAPA